MVMERFWNDSKEEPIRYQGCKFNDIGLPVFLKYQYHHELPKYCIVGPKSIMFFPKGGLWGEGEHPAMYKYELTDKAIRHQKRNDIKETIYQEYKDVDFRYPTSPQLGNNWLLYLLEDSKMLVGVNYAVPETSLKVLVSSDVECFSLDGDHLIVLMTTTRRAGMTNRIYSGAIKAQADQVQNISFTSKISIGTAKIDFASDISLSNQFTCVKHSADHNICIMANTDLDTEQNHIMVSRPGHNGASPVYKILEIQSLQISTRTTPIKHIKLLVPDYRFSFAILAESSQLHVAYFIAGREIFGVLQFNEAVGTEDADIYGIEMMSKEQFIIFGYDVLEVYKVCVKMNPDF